MNIKKFLAILISLAILPISAIPANAVDTSKPDPKIAAEDLSVSPTTINQGTSVTFKAKVRNGSSAKATSIKARFFLGDVQIGEKTISSISANSYYSTSLTYKIPNTIYGEQLYKLVIDPDNAIAESDETNNSAEIKISIGETKPDLEVTAADLSTSKENPQGGDKVTLKATVKNIGNSSATNVLVRFLMNDAKIYEKTVSTISKNGKNSVSYTYQLPDVVSGDQIFKVMVDPDNTIAEFNETNNSAQYSITTSLTERNLVLESFSPSVANPKPGQKMSWKLKVKNTGNATAKNVKLALYTDIASSKPYSTITISTLNGGASQTKSINWTVPEHLSPVIDYPVRAEVDSDNSIAETNEFDNVKSSSVSLKVPDISLGLGEYMNLNTYNIYNGTFSQIKVKVKNDNVDIVKNIKLTLYYALDLPTATRTKLSEITISTLAKNATYDQIFDRVSLPTLPVGTTAYIIAVADSDDTVTELSETNNELVFRRNVVVRPAQAQYPYLSVTVQDENGDSLRNATVKLTSSGFSAKTKVTGSDTLSGNAAGIVTFDALPASGQFTVTVSATGYRTQTETFTYAQGSDDSMYKTYTMDEKAVLSGTVKNQAGTPLAYATVKIDGIGLETTTDADGKYGFMLNGGTYTLKFLKQGYNRIIENNLSVPALSTITLDKTMTTGTVAYVSGIVTDDEGTGLANADIYVNGTMIAVTASDGRFTFNNMSAGTKNFKFKKPGYVDTEFSETVEAGNEYYFSFTMFKPSTDSHVERGTQIVSWHQHEGTPANAFFIPEYNVDVWWGMGRVKMAMDFNKSGDTAKLTKLVINNHGLDWECNKVEGEGDIETSAIDIPITISAGSCSGKKTQMDVYKVTIESDGDEVWQDTSFWTSASDPMNTGTKSFTLSNLNVSWNDNFKVKMWVRVQKRAVIGTDGDGSGALYGYHMDKKLITWYPKKPATTVISTGWGQIGGYFLGILDNPVTAITSFTDLFTVERFNQYTMEDVLSQDFPGSPPQY